MICKFCNAEVGEDHKFCPYCGKDLAAQEELVQITETQETELTDCKAGTQKKRKWKVWQLVLAICGAVVALCVLAVCFLYAFGVDLKPRANDIFKKDSYTVSDTKYQNKVTEVIAQVGENKLTNGILQLYYADAVYTFVDNYYYYLSSYGLDIDKPLDEQTCLMDDSMTWEQYFLDNALESWRRYAVLENMAKASGFELDEDMQKHIEDMPKQLEEFAKSNKFDTVQAWLEENFGPGITQEDYIVYSTTYYTGSAYLVSRYDEMMPTDEQIDAYFAENEASFKENGITKESGKYYDVRHILIEPEGGKEGENGTVTYTDEQWEACRIKAQALLDQWKSGDATESAFAELAAEHSIDTGSSSNGGLYSQLTKETNFVEEFKTWYLDSTRKQGDTGLVKSVYGYHIMYFSGSQDIWYYTATQQMLADSVSKLIEEGKQTFSSEVTYGKIALSKLEF